MDNEKKSEFSIYNKEVFFLNSIVQTTLVLVFTFLIIFLEMYFLTPHLLESHFFDSFPKIPSSDIDIVSLFTFLIGFFSIIYTLLKETREFLMKEKERTNESLKNGDEHHE